MSAIQPGAREIARGLSAALAGALGAGATALDRLAARDVAQLLGLAGLDAALAVVNRHAGPRCPLEITHLAQRLGRLAESAERDGDLGAIWNADRELAALAGQLESIDFQPSPASPSQVRTITVRETFADLRVNGGSELEHVRLTAAVAASLRAAIDWLGFDLVARLDCEVQDTALTLTGPVPNVPGIAPAGAVLAAIEGSLGRGEGERWTVRVPLHVERPSYLLMRQGRLALALPWHAVSRLRMFSPQELSQLSEPTLPLLATLDASALERPAALVSLGLARGWLVADRIVWRITADPMQAGEAGPFSSALAYVSVESGERYWVVPPSWILRGIAPTELPASVTAFALPKPAEPPARPPAAESAPGSASAPAAGGTEPAARIAPAFVLFVPPQLGGIEMPPEPAGTTHGVAETIQAASGEFDASSISVLAAGDVLARHALPAGGSTPAPPAAQLDTTEAPPPSPSAALHAPAIEVLGPGDVSPRRAPPPRRTTTLLPAPDEPDEPRVERVPGRRALVADDSLVARIFLGRLLERRGYVVECVGDAVSMWSELNHGPWDLVCADASMPDAPDPAHLRALLELRDSARTPFTLVVLTRDEQDERLATAAGAELHLRKPFDTDALDQLLSP